MLRARPAPVTILTLSLLAVASLALGALGLATNQPWLGLTLAAGEGPDVRIVAVDPDGPARDVPVPATLKVLRAPDGSAVAPVGMDLIDEPDAFETYRRMGAFFERQDRLDRVLRADYVDIEVAADDGSTATVRVRPASARPLHDLPAAFWIQLFVGVAGFGFSAWVWSLRWRDTSTRLFAAVGASILCFSFAAGIYSTRELALDGGLFRALSAANHAGALAFGAAMIALLLHYPRRLVRTRYLLVPAVVFGGWWAGDTLWLFPGPPLGLHLPTVLEMAGILACAAVQFRATRGDPRARAALRWFGLSIAVGAGAFVLTVVIPNLLGIAPGLPQGYAFLFFLLIHAGLALGVARFRLFDLDDWAFRIFFYLGGVFLLVALDAFLIYTVSVEPVSAFGVALLVVAFAYLPFRESLDRRLRQGRVPDRAGLYQRAVDVALTPTGTSQRARWEGLLTEVFGPLRMVPDDAAEVAIEDDGVALRVPGVDALPGVRLDYARGGRRLFTSRDAELAREIHAVLRHTLEGREAYEKGVAAERERIARDIHDNIGVQLLSALHSAEAPRKNTLIRETLTDLRDIINNAAGAERSLDEVLADLRAEVAEHLAVADVALRWDRVSGTTPDVAPGTLAIQVLRSLIREATGNVVKHAGASVMRVAVAERDGVLTIRIEDDGRGFDTRRVTRGNGLSNMRRRMTAMGGTLEVISGEAGTRVVARFAIGRGG